MKLETWIKAITILICVLVGNGLIASFGYGPIFLSICVVMVGICMDGIIWTALLLVCLLFWSYISKELLEVMAWWKKLICGIVTIGLYLTLTYIGYAPGHMFVNWHLTSRNLIGG